MDRRTFMTASLGMAVVGGALPRRDAYALSVQARGQVRVLIDPTLRESREHAARLGGGNGRLIAVGEDVGALWHGRLRHWVGLFEGTLRPSDCFVLRTFAMADGRTFHCTWTGPQAIAFAIGADRAVARTS